MATYTIQAYKQGVPGLKVWTETITSETDGSVADTLKGLRGFVYRVVFTPGTGDNLPTDDSDWTIKDKHGVDILLTGGTDVGQTGITDILPYKTLNATDYPFPVASTLSIVGATVGNTKQMTIDIYYSHG